MKAHSLVDEQFWLVSRRTDFWLACGGASLALLASVLVILWRGDRELDALDFVLSEAHLGATYDAVIRRRLWRRLPADVLLVPSLILAITYALSLSGQTMMLTSIAMYAAVWHRARQSLGVARFYQRAMGGPVSRLHDILFRGAIYLPMFSGMMAYAYLAPLEYEGEAYFALNFGAELTLIVGSAAIAWAIAYVLCTLRPYQGERAPTACRRVANQVHPGERWAVLAHSVAFGSGYVLGATNASFLLVLAVYHEVQYLFFTYAMARRAGTFPAVSTATLRLSTKHCATNLPSNAGSMMRGELKFAASFLPWPLIGLTAAIIGERSRFGWLAPLGIGGLFCHYWLDGRIWTRASYQS